MRKIRIVFYVIILLGVWYARTIAPPRHGVGAPVPIGSDGRNSTALAEAIRTHAADAQVEGSGKVVKVLPDDTEGDRHQRFILEVAPGQTVLVAHNIDIAPRVEALMEGDEVFFKGYYIWNDKGGVVHWTHHDPGGKHATGYLKLDGKVYQ